MLLPLLLLILPCVLGAKGFFYPKYRHEMYNKMIPEDTEVDVLLHKGQPHKMYFVLESGYRPLSVTVTPCSAEGILEWKISHSIFQNPVDGAYRSGAWSNHVVRPPSPAATYIGQERRSYSTPRAPPGVYALELRSSGAGRARVLVTTRSTTQMPYHPPLPPDPTVRIVKIKRNRILVSWKASLSPNNIHYCVSANNKGNFNSMCSAESHGNIHCVGRKTWHLFKGLHRSRTYYLDVFVVDAETNASSAYVGVSATLRNIGGAPLIPRLKDDSLATFTLDESNGYVVNTKYQLPNTPGPLLVFLQSCTGPGPVNVHISQGGGAQKHDIMSTTVMDVKTLQLPRPTVALRNTSSFLSFSIRSTGRQERRVRLWISGRRKSPPFPQLPSDKGVRVLDSLTTCDSVTIGWKSSPDERVRYCIYKQAARDPISARPQDFCEEPPGGSPARQPVLCRRYHRFSRRRFSSLILQRVKGLRRGTAYLFEVQVTKVKGRMLPYEQVWATTLDTCNRNAR